MQTHNAVVEVVAAAEGGGPLHMAECPCGWRGTAWYASHNAAAEAARHNHEARRGQDNPARKEGE